MKQIDLFKPKSIEINPVFARHETFHPLTFQVMVFEDGVDNLYDLSPHLRKLSELVYPFHLPRGAYSDAIRPLIPIDVGHPFRSIPAIPYIKI